MNLPALPGAPRPSLDRTATNHSRSPGGAPTIRNRENPHLTPGFLGFRLDKKHGSYRNDPRGGFPRESQSVAPGTPH